MNKKTFIVAEVGLAHDGSLGIAKSFIHIDLLYEEDGFEMRPNSWVY